MTSCPAFAVSEGPKPLSAVDPVRQPGREIGQQHERQYEAEHRQQERHRAAGDIAEGTAACAHALRHEKIYPDGGVIRAISINKVSTTPNQTSEYSGTFRPITSGKTSGSVSSIIDRVSMNIPITR